MPGPGDQTSAAEGRNQGDLRASHADRERVIRILKAALEQGRLTEDEHHERTAKASVSRSGAELAGLTADLKESAGRTQSGNITKAGSAPLRWALCQAAVTLCQCDARQEAIRQRLIRRLGKAKANVAMGRRLLRTLYAMVRDQKPYRCGQHRDRTTRLNKARAARKQAAEQAA